MQGIINTLPKELAETLTEAFLNTRIDQQNVFGKERLLEFDKKGKNIKKKLEQFLGGELQARFLFSVRDFFSEAFETLGALPEKAKEFVETEFERFQTVDSREERAAIGQGLIERFRLAAGVLNMLNNEGVGPLTQQLRAAEAAAKEFGFEGIPSLEQVDEKLRELLRDFDDPQALKDLANFRVDLAPFEQALESLRTGVENLLNNQGLGPLTQQLRAAEAAAKEFGFEGIPSLEQVDEKLRELLRDFDDPQALKDLADFRQGLLALRTELAAGITSFAAQIRTTAGRITDLGRLIGRDFPGLQEAALRTNIESLGEVLTDATLSSQQYSAALNEQQSNIQELISLEQQRFEESKRAQLAALGIQLEALRKLQTDFTGVFAAAGNALLQLRTGSDSILSPAARLQTVRDEISGLQGRVPAARGADLVDIQQRLTQLFPEAVRIAREGFGEGSSAAFAQFAAAEEGLKLVQDQTLGEVITQQGLTARQNEIAARIEAINNRQFAVSSETKRIVDAHLSSQVSLLEQQQSQRTRMHTELEKASGLAARQNEIAARIEAINNRQFAVLEESQSIVDAHLSSQVSLLEEQESQQSAVLSEIERASGILRRILSSLDRSSKEPLEKGSRRR